MGLVARDAALVKRFILMLDHARVVNKKREKKKIRQRKRLETREKVRIRTKDK
jgi:hypothetical protein